jgi:hypothetical protein
MGLESNQPMRESRCQKKIARNAKIANIAMIEKEFGFREQR